MAHDQVVLLARVTLAAVLGFFIGWERHVHGSPAGDRTHAIVAIGAATFATIATLHFSSTGGQLIGGIVTGVGFMGVGLIFRQQSGPVHGLTSAAGLWVTAAIGVVCGIGYPFAATGVTLIVLLMLMWDRLPVLKSIGPYEQHVSAPAAESPPPPDAGAKT